MTQEISPFQKTTRHAFARLGLEIINGLYDVSMSGESESHVRSVARELENNPSLSLIMYANHIANSDGAFLMWLHYQYFDSQRKLIAPAAYKYMDKKSHPVWARFAQSAASAFGVDLVPVMQVYMVGEGREYSEQDAMHTYRELIRKVHDSRPCDLAIFPEGHRSETRELENAENGAVKLARALRPAMFLPVGITPQEGMRRTNIPARLGFGGEFDRGVNLGGAFRLEVGEGILLQQGERADIDELMMNLARLLPEDMRGVYPILEP